MRGCAGCGGLCAIVSGDRPVASRRSPGRCTPLTARVNALVIIGPQNDFVPGVGDGRAGFRFAHLRPRPRRTRVMFVSASQTTQTIVPMILRWANSKAPRAATSSAPIARTPAAASPMFAEPARGKSD